MPLDSLLSLVEKLRERIDAHGSKLRQSEALTRYALIDPLLRELGWDTGNPDLVIPEYKVGGGRADYALLNNGKPTMMVEAKSLESPLQDALSQGIGYCLEQGTPYFSVTDGRRWEIYETHKPVPIDEKRIVRVRFEGRVGCRGVPEGIGVVETQRRLSGRRIAQQTGKLRFIDRPPDPPSPPESPTPNPQPPSPGLDEHEWQPISELNLQRGHTSPRAVRFPDWFSPLIDDVERV